MTATSPSSDAAAVGRPESDAPPRLFVYGSLRIGQQNPMAELLHRNSRHLGPATVCGRLYVISWYGGMVPGEAADECVSGDAFELHVDAAERVLAELDAYEGDDFERRRVEVTLEDETRVGADAYLYAASVAGLPRVAHGDWLRRG